MVVPCVSISDHMELLTALRRVPAREMVIVLMGSLTGTVRGEPKHTEQGSLTHTHY